MLATAAALVVLAVQAVPPPPAEWVEDHAGLMSPAARRALDEELAGYQRATGHQVVVWIGRSLDGQPLDDWATRTFAAWKLGRAGQDDGIALFVLVADRAIAIEVGYGLEGQVPDAIAARIIAEVIAPKLRAGDGDGAMVAGSRAILTAIEGHPWTGRAPPPEPAWPPFWQLVLGAAAMALLLALAIRHPRAALWILLAFARGAGRRGGGGRGFGGGGGRSGGGGARGRW